MWRTLNTFLPNRKAKANFGYISVTGNKITSSVQIANYFNEFFGNLTSGINSNGVADGQILLFVLVMFPLM